MWGAFPVSQISSSSCAVWTWFKSDAQMCPFQWQLMLWKPCVYIHNNMANVPRIALGSEIRWSVTSLSETMSDRMHGTLGSKQRCVDRCTSVCVPPLPTIRPSQPPFPLCDTGRIRSPISACLNLHAHPIEPIEVVTDNHYSLRKLLCACYTHQIHSAQHQPCMCTRYWISLRDSKWS